MLNQQRLAELDELVHLCRDDQAKQDIAEAIACYKAGAFRSCIVATWIAVVFNFIHKLRELDLAGDAQAKVRLTELETIRAKNDLQASLEFERELLNRAKDEFELISGVEHSDLERLYKDRHCCAHPSMNVDEEIYQPTPELTLHYVRIAVTYLLQHPPVQGKAALQRLMGEVTSKYFPKTKELAVVHFESGPLSKARESLVRNFVICLLKTLLREQHDNDSENRHTVAFSAVWQMYASVTEKTLTEKLSELMRLLTDEQFEIAIKRLRGIADYGKFIQDDVRERRRNCLSDIYSKDPTLALLIGLKEEPLRTRVVEHLKQIDVQQLLNLVKAERHPDLVPRAVELYVQSKSYDSANIRGTELIIPLAEYLTIEQIEIIIKGISENEQIKNSFKVKDILTCIQSTNKISNKEFSNLIKKYSLEHKFASFILFEESA
jgi:hypothetical protein